MIKYLASTKRPDDGLIYHHFYFDENTSQIYRTSLIMDELKCNLYTFGYFINGEIIRAEITERVRTDMPPKPTNKLVYVEYNDDIVNLILEKILDKL